MQLRDGEVGVGGRKVKGSFMKAQLVACSKSKRIKISGAATNMHKKRSAQEASQWVGY